MRPLFLLALPFLGACNSECGDPTRVNGTWAVFHQVVNIPVDDEASVDAGYPSYEMFVNGWSRWDLTWSAAGNVTLAITDAAEAQGTYGEGGKQSFLGTMNAAEGNCNTMQLAFAGDFVTASATTHAFDYLADLTFTGDQLSGTFAYTDTWTATGEDGGGLAGANGQMRAALQTDGFDTGF